jgi:two-component system, OmpR family, sensor kinase
LSNDAGQTPPLVRALNRRIDELTAELAEARRAVRARDDFLAIAAHELRTPMNSFSLRIAALARLARRSGACALAEQLERATRTIDRYVSRATLLLEVTRLNSGRLALQPTAVDLTAVAAEVLDAHADDASFHGVALEVDAPARLIGVWDPQALEGILSNLVSNALKYGGAGPVRVRVFSDRAGRACVAVEDRGPGIDESQRRRIFEKFEQLFDGPDARNGFGLGLWIVGRLVEAHNGSIDVSTAPGAGSIFTVRLPLSPDRPAHGRGGT